MVRRQKDLNGIIKFQFLISINDAMADPGFLRGSLQPRRECQTFYGHISRKPHENNNKIGREGNAPTLNPPILSFAETTEH